MIRIINAVRRYTKFLVKIIVVSAYRPVETGVVLFIVALTLGGIIFYQYSILAQEEDIEITGRTLFLKEDIYQEILEAWQEHEQRFQAADTKEYADPFNIELPVVGETPKS